MKNKKQKQLMKKPSSKLLQAFGNIEKGIAEIDDLRKLHSLRDTAAGFEKAWNGYFKSSGFGFEQMFYGWEVKIRAERKMGEILETIERRQGRRTDLTSGHDVRKLAFKEWCENHGIKERQGRRYEQISKFDKDKFDRVIEELRLSFIEPTTNFLLRTLIGVHVGQSTGEDEWYTPSKFIEAARKTMGSIDLDPASTSIANKIVKAGRYYTKEMNGLEQKWFGNVWMNPPYSQPLIEYFADKLVDSFNKKQIKQACVLVNNATETQWFQTLLGPCSLVCFLKGRIKFIDKEGKATGAPLQGQAILYFGNNEKKFNENFSQFGIILWHKEEK